MSGGTRSYEFASRLSNLSHSVTVLTTFRTSSTKPSWFSTTENSFNVYWLPVLYSNSFSYARRIYSFIKFAFFCIPKSLLTPADIIFATSTPLTVVIPAIISSFLRGIPFVLEVRDLWPEMPIAMGALRNPFLRSLANLLEIVAYKSARSIVALSPGMRDGIIRRGVNPSKVCVIPNGCDISTFKSAVPFDFSSLSPSLHGKKILLYPGTFGKVNNLGYAVELASSLLKAKSNISIVLVGGGSEREKIIKKSQLNGTYDVNFFVFDRLPKSMMPSVFMASDMVANFVVDLPQAYNNSANKFFDALAASKPVLINTGGWMHDLVSFYQCGLSIWNLSFDTAATALDSFVNSPSDYNSAITSASFLARSYFDRDHLTSQLNNVLLSSLSGDSDVVSIADGDFFP